MTGGSVIMLDCTHCPASLPAAVSWCSGADGAASRSAVHIADAVQMRRRHSSDSVHRQYSPALVFA